MITPEHDRFVCLLYDLIRDGKGEQIAMMLRALAKDRANWSTNRKYVGAASTLLIAYNYTNEYAKAGLPEACREVIHFIHKAGFTSEELLPFLTLLA